MNPSMHVVRPERAGLSRRAAVLRHHRVARLSGFSRSSSRGFALAAAARVGLCGWDVVPFFAGGELL